MARELPVLPVVDLRDGTMVEVPSPVGELLIARVCNEIYAVGGICSHFYARLAHGELDVGNCAVKCPMHEASFDLRTGEAVEPPAEDPIKTYPVKVADGMIVVTIDQ